MEITDRVMKINEIVEHRDKVSKSGYPHDKQYIYVRDVRCKDRTSGEWYDAVMYVSTDGEGCFVRDKNDFEKNFKSINEK